MRGPEAKHGWMGNGSFVQAREQGDQALKCHADTAQKTRQVLRPVQQVQPVDNRNELRPH